MSYRQIAALVENENAASSLALTATRIGTGIHAQVNAIHLSPRYTPDAQMKPYFTHDQLQQLQQQSEQIAADSKAEFIRIMSQGDCSWKWTERTVESYQDFGPFRTEALTSDLLLIGIKKGSNTIDLLRALLLDTGTPVIAVPVGSAMESLGRRIVVVWNGSVASARALRDALPLLVNADSIEVVIIDETNDSIAIQTEHSALERYLQQHNIDAHYQVLPEERYQTAAHVLDYSGQHGGDLLVMGGYVHSRVHRMMMGPTTSQVLQNTSIPVFLSH